jgi:hypothetical protein
VQGQALTSSLKDVQLIWLAESDKYFLPFRFVVEQLDRIGMHNLFIGEAPPIAHSERVEKILNVVTQILDANVPKGAFLSGDGAVVHAVSDRLTTAGLGGEDIRIECFFNNPQRKIAA